MTSPSTVKFIDEELEKAFNSLSDEDPIKKAIIRAIQNIKEEARLHQTLQNSRNRISCK